MAHPTFPMKAPDAQHCNARRLKHNAYCTRQAGWGTLHLGSGRCKLHGGSAHYANITHGRHSAVLVQGRIKGLYEQYKADPDPLNMLDELHMARAIMVDFINRYEQFSEALLAWHESYEAKSEKGKKPRQILDISHAMTHVDAVTRIVERIEKLRSENAISQPELARILWEMRRTMELYVSDEKTRERILKAWATIGLR